MRKCARANDYDCVIVCASMGPQLYRCGNRWNRYLCRFCVLEASMGPQLYRCGNISEPSGNVMSLPSLQWGRNFIVAETQAKVKDCVDFSWKLQWGRNFIVAETVAVAPRHRTGLGFNGAATLSLRKPQSVDTHPRALCAPMGPQLYRCGNTSPADGVHLLP